MSGASVHDLTAAMDRLKLLPGGRSNPLSRRIDALSAGTERGFRASDGRFDQDKFGPLWVVFAERQDNVYWRPQTGEVATLYGRAFALGESLIEDAATYSLDGVLHINSTIEGWLLDKYRSIYVIDWSQAFDKLRNAPRVGLDNDFQEIYHQHMRPARMPKVYVRRENAQDHA